MLALFAYISYGLFLVGLGDGDSLIAIAGAACIAACAVAEKEIKR